MTLVVVALSSPQIERLIDLLWLKLQVLLQGSRQELASRPGRHKCSLQRYHAISLVAVFLALGIGVVLGVAIGENGVVSEASRDLEKSLRGDLDTPARERPTCAATSRSAGTLRAAGLSRPGPRPAVGWRIGIVAMGSLPPGYVSGVRDAVEPAGALDSVTVIEAPLPLDRIASELEGTKLGESTATTTWSSGSGGGSGASSCRVESWSTASARTFLDPRGEYRGLDAIVCLIRGRDGLKRTARPGRTGSKRDS